MNQVKREINKIPLKKVFMNTEKGFNKRKKERNKTEKKQRSKERKIITKSKVNKKERKQEIYEVLRDRKKWRMKFV